jgi:hypothetical protein
MAKSMAWGYPRVGYAALISAHLTPDACQAGHGFDIFYRISLAAVIRYEHAGHPRTIRTIQRYCAKDIWLPDEAVRRQIRPSHARNATRMHALVRGARASPTRRDRRSRVAAPMLTDTTPIAA